jgi:CubicO group peptidase (beta-lactamase class C family)
LERGFAWIIIPHIESKFSILSKRAEAVIFFPMQRAQQIRADREIPAVQGLSAAQFAPVRAAFERHFSEHDEVGASVGVSLNGETVVDLWGGWRDAAKTRPWQRSSVACQWAVSKSVNAICFAMLINRGLASYADRVCHYWPEFGAAGKHRVTIAMLLAHQTGVTGFASAAVTEDLYAGEVSALRLAGQAPFWEPGHGAGYHPISLGILANALFRRIEGRSIQQFVLQELARPFGLDLSVGAPADRPETAAEMIPPPAGTALFPEDTPARRAANNPPFDSAMANAGVFSAADLCAVNGYANGRSMAELYSLFMGTGSDGRVLVSREVFTQAIAPRAEGIDIVRGSFLRWTAGFQLNMDGLFGPNPDVIFHTGMGGTFTLADPDAGVTLSYVPNRMGNLYDREPRRTGLVKALYESL